MDESDITVMPADELRDERGEIRSEFVEQITAAIESEDAASLRTLAGDLHEADMGALLEALDPEQRPRLIELMGSEFDFTALTEVDYTVREDILEELPTETVAEGVRELDSDDAAELLKYMPEEDQAEILDQIPASERDAIERSLDYPVDSAGLRMQTELIAVPPTWTAGQVIDFMRDTVDLPDRFFEVYVVDAAHRFLGAVPLDRLLRAQRPVAVSELMEEDRHRVKATDDQEEVARVFGRYNLVAVPVVDAEDRLVGVITYDDLADVISEEAEEDIKALGGVSGEEELSDTVATIARSRFLWLFANLFTALAAAWVISRFQGSIEKMVSLAVLMPIVASMGGNAGTQTMTVAVRALATRDLTTANVGRVVRRELLVGVINGCCFAVILGVVSVAWFHVSDLGFVIGLAMVCVLTAAALGGILIPLGLSKLGVDPAVSSGPFVTTITDVVGFFSFLGIATVWFGLK